MVRYYGYYSNKSRGMRKKTVIDDQVPALVKSTVSSMGKTAIICLVRHVGSKFADALIVRL
jgi:hypothetical protein